MEKKNTIEENVIDFSQINDEYIGDEKIINKIDCPCEELKNKLSVCMKNSDDNIIVCQSLRDAFESCLRENKA